MPGERGVTHQMGMSGRRGRAWFAIDFNNGRDAICHEQFGGAHYVVDGENVGFSFVRCVRPCAGGLELLSARWNDGIAVFQMERFSIVFA